MQYGLIGEHLPHSFSKIIHEKIGLYEYELHEAAKDELDSFMKKREFKGINVTIPYKQDVIRYLDEISERAKKIGAVNTIVNRDGKLFGDNTDFGGMEALFEKMGLELSKRKVVILGTGGTSKTAYAVAEHMGADEIYKVSRSEKEGALSYDELYEKHTDAQIIINTTPCGMYPKWNACPVDISKFKSLEGVLDAIYNPLKTRFVQSAIENGAAGEGGLYMLVAQAVIAAEIFTGKEFEKSLTDDIYESLLKEKRNIVLIGMPGSGKSTVGKILSKRTGYKFLDSDAVLIKKEKKEIKQIFSEVGESGFRDIESEVIEELSTNNGIIIATGGGAVLREENVRALRSNGVIVFLDRDPVSIKPTDDRPLSDNEEKLKKLYETRYPVYTKAADVSIDNNKTLDETIDEICRILKI